MGGEWQANALSDLTDPETPVTYGVVKPGDEDPDGVLFIRGGDIADGHVLADQLRTISKEVSNQYKRTLLRGGEIVMSLVGNPGQVAIVPSTLSGANIARQAALIRLRRNVDSHFVYYFLRSPLGQEALGAHSRGSVQQVINLRDLKTVVVPTPPLHEQRAIAHILGTLDDKIELNRRRNQTLEAMARALFKDWFVDFGPVRAKMAGRAGQNGQVSGQRHEGRASGPTDPYLPADLWQLFPDRLDDEGKPEGWIERPLDEIADFLNGLALQKFPAIDPEDSVPVIKIAELRNGVSAKSDRASREVPAKYVIKDGDFLFSWSGSLLAKFWTEGEGALNQHLFKVTSESYPMWFVSHWVHHHLEDFQAIAASKATTMGHIQRGHLKAAMTLCPPDDVLEKLGVVVTPLIDQSIHNELESRQLAQLRDTLLPTLISGELRLADAKKFLEGVGR